MFYIPVNSYGHVETVSSPNHTFSWLSLDQYFVHLLSLVTDNNPFLNQYTLFHDKSSGKCGTWSGLNSQSLESQLDSLPTTLRGPVTKKRIKMVILHDSDLPMFEVLLRTHCGEARHLSSKIKSLTMLKSSDNNRVFIKTVISLSLPTMFLIVSSQVKETKVVFLLDLTPRPLWFEDQDV